jgi:hypothetical protein
MHKGRGSSEVAGERLEASLEAAELLMRTGRPGDLAEAAAMLESGARELRGLEGDEMRNVLAQARRRIRRMTALLERGLATRVDHFEAAGRRLVNCKG